MKFIRLGSITSIRTGKLNANASNIDGEYPFFSCSKETLKINTYSYDCECVLVAGNGDLNVKYYNGKFDAYQRTYIIESLDKSKYSVKYIYYFMCFYINVLRTQSIGGVIKYIKLNNLTEAKIPDISLIKQNQIINIISQLENSIYISKNIVSNLAELIKSRFIELFGDVLNFSNYEFIKLNQICSSIGGGTPSTKNLNYYNGDIPWITTTSLGNNFIGIESAKSFISLEALNNSSTHLIPKNSIIVGTRVNVGKSSINKVDLCTNQDINSLVNIDISKWNILYIKHVLDKYYDYFNSIKKGATILGITKNDLLNVNIPRAPLLLQNEFAEFVQLIDKSKLIAQIQLDLLNELLENKLAEFFG